METTGISLGCLAGLLQAVLSIEQLHQDERGVVMRNPGMLPEQRSQLAAIFFQFRRIAGQENLPAQSLNLIGDVVDFHLERLGNRQRCEYPENFVILYQYALGKLLTPLGIGHRGQLKVLSSAAP